MPDNAYGLLRGRHALVTGGGRGVGLGIALGLARQGCNVAVNYPHEAARAEAERAVTDLQALGVEAFTVQADVRDANAVAMMIAEVTSRFPKLDLMVNNSGIQVEKPLLDLTEDDWDSVIDTNLKGCFLCTQAAARHMRDAGSGGAIVNIGSGCSKLAFPRLASYVASKGGIEMLTKAAAADLGRYGIRVNCVAPGAIVTERTLHDDPNFDATWGGVTPLGRAGVPADVAGAVAYLASDLAAFVTGQTLWVDGGVFSNAPWPYPMK